MVWQGCVGTYRRGMVCMCPLWVKAGDSPTPCACKLSSLSLPPSFPPVPQRWRSVRPCLVLSALPQLLLLTEPPLWQPPARSPASGTCCVHSFGTPSTYPPCHAGLHHRGGCLAWLGWAGICWTRPCRRLLHRHRYCETKTGQAVLSWLDQELLGHAREGATSSA